MNNNNKLLLVSLLFVTTMFITGCANSESRQNIETKSSTVQVSKFFNGKDGYSLSIPTGNNSTCIWTWSAGSGRIPDSKTTKANSATEKHTIQIYGGEEDFKVVCVDDFGGKYDGVFPAQ
jgi:hypothetical protein